MARRANSPAPRVDRTWGTSSTTGCVLLLRHGVIRRAEVSGLTPTSLLKKADSLTWHRFPFGEDGLYPRQGGGSASAITGWKAVHTCSTGCYGRLWRRPGRAAVYYADSTGMSLTRGVRAGVGRTVVAAVDTGLVA